MKKHKSRLLFILLLLGFFCSCKKNDDAGTKDPAAFIKDKTWWGTITYTNDTVQYYSVHFAGDNTLLWSQLTGDYTGRWAINNNSLTMTFDANTVQINADLTEDNKMANITDNTGFYNVNSGALIPDAKISLDNTIWNGYQYPVTSGQPLVALKLNFLPLSVVIITKAGLSYGPYPYTRSSSGAVIKTKSVVNSPSYPYPFFCVITSATEIKGCDAATPFRWNTLKQ